MNVSLGPAWESFIERKVNSGDFSSPSEVVCEGLKLLKEQELIDKVSVTTVAELEAKLLEAVESLDAGEREDGEAVFARLREMSAAARRRNA